MKDGLKWVALVFAAALLIILVVSQKDKFTKEMTDDTQVSVTSIDIQDKSDSEEDVATGTQEVSEDTNQVIEVNTVGTKADENGIQIAP